MMRNVFYASLVLLAAVSCVQPEQGDKVDAAAVTAEVEAMFEAYHEAVAAKGLTGEFPYLDSTDQFFWVPPGYTSALNIDSVRAILEANAPLFSSVRFHWETLDVYPLANDIASFTGIVHSTMVDTAGLSTEMRIIESGVVIRRKEGWKLLCGQSALLPGE